MKPINISFLLLFITVYISEIYGEEEDSPKKFTFSNLAFRLVNKTKMPSPTIRKAGNDSDILDTSVGRLKHNPRSHAAQSKSAIKVGIVGAGIAGLYSALLLQDLGINYEIIEASKEIGGRFDTFNFDGPPKYNYVELGAMRFPKTDEFDRVNGKQNWSLINYLNSKVDKEFKLKMIPFYLTHPNNIFHFNGQRKYRSEVENSSDQFGFSVNKGGFVDEKYALKNAMHWEDIALDFIKKKLDTDLISGYEYLLSNDHNTFRAFLMDPKNGFGYPADVIDWIEDVTAQTGKFSYSFLDIFMGHHLFSNEIETIDGGFSRLPTAMNSLLRKKPKFQHVVKRVSQDENNNMIVHTNAGPLEYTHLIMTPTLTAMRDINFDCDLHLKKRLAMRSARYEPAVKIGLQFKTRFWEDASLMSGKPIFGGITQTDLPVRQIVYPSYGINCTSCIGSLLVSYTLFRDAMKMSGLPEKQLVKTCLKDLATIHGDFIFEQYTGTYQIMDWSKNKWTQGALGAFEPGFFMSYYPYLIQPDANNRLFLAGDSLSVYHGWTIGALVSSYRSVKDILKTTPGLTDKLTELKQKWGTIDEPDFNDVQYE